MATSDEEAAARSEVLLRDAEEALARERLHEFWKAWGSTIIGMAVMLVVGTGAGVAWREWRDSRNAASTAQLLGVIENDQAPMSADLARNMNDDHAAIAWLSRASVSKPEDLERLYEGAAKDGGGSVWGWLGRWNLLRLRMDDETADTGRLVADYENLANDMKGRPLAALAWADAAVIAGERGRDPAAALDYLSRAEKAAPRGTPMAVMIADLRHLYEIRAQTLNDESRNTQPAEPETKQ